MNFTTNYRVRHVSDNPERDGKYRLVKSNGKLTMFDWEFKNGEWDLPACEVTHYLEPIDESVCLTKSEVEKMLRDAWDIAIGWYNNSGGPADDFFMNKDTYINSLLSPDKNK